MVAVLIECRDSGRVIAGKKDLAWRNLVACCGRCQCNFDRFCQIL